MKTSKLYAITILVSLMFLVVGCRTTTPVTRQTHATLNLSPEDALKVVVNEIPRVKGSTFTCDFDASGFSWTEYVPPPPPIVIMPTSTTLYSAGSGGMVAQTYTTPGVVVPSSGRGTTLRGKVRFEDVVRISQVDVRKVHWINLQVKEKKRVYSVPVGDCPPQQMQRISEAFLSLCPNAN